MHCMHHVRGSTHPVDVEDVDVASPQLLERLLNRKMKGFHIVPGISSVLLDVRPPALIVRRILHPHPSPISHPIALLRDI